MEMMDKKKIILLIEEILERISRAGLNPREKKVVYEALKRIVKQPDNPPDSSHVAEMVAKILAEFTAMDSEYRDEFLIGELLKKEGLATDLDIEKASRKQYRLRKNGRSRLLGDILVEDGVITLDAMNEFIRKYYKGH
jgi:hypothetical protein